MDEEKIIDGVDVSECRFYHETLKAYNNGTISSSKGYGFCTHNIKGLNNAGCYAENFARCLNNNCYYKQLKRLEQENEELKNRFNDYQDRKIEENANLMKRLDIADKKLTVFSRELEQANKENEELKNKLQILDDEILTVEITVEEFENYKKYKHALEEIKEMLPESKCKYACFSCPESGQCKEEWAEPIKRIVTEAIGK